MQSLKKIATILLPILLGVFLVYYTFKDFTADQWIQIKNYFATANYYYVFLSLLFMKISQASRAYRWNYQLEYLGYKSPFLLNFAAISVGYLVNLSIPRLGEVSRATILKKYKKIPFNVGFGTIIAERMIDLIVLFFCIIVTLFFQYDVLQSFIGDYIGSFQKLSVFVLLLVIFFGFVFWLTQTKFHWLQKLKNKLSGFSHSLLSIIKMPSKGRYFLHTIIIWGGFICSFYYGMLALPETSELSIGAVLSAFIVGSFAVSFTNGGLGAFPLFISNILLLYGIPKTAGIAIGWILWTSQTLLIVILGVISFFYLSIKNKESWQKK